MPQMPNCVEKMENFKIPFQKKTERETRHDMADDDIDKFKFK
jgi:hypothetical protein